MEDLAKQLVSVLQERGMTVSTAESCTGGMIAQAITSVPGASAVFEYGVVTYANRIKAQELGVAGESLARYGAVSEQVAVEMAEGVRRRAPSSIGIAVTGIAGPGGGTAEKPVGTVFAAVSGDGFCRVTRLSLLEECGDDRRRIREATVKYSIMLALEEINREQQVK